MNIPASFKVWFSELTPGTAITGILGIAAILAGSEAIKVLISFGIPESYALAIQHGAASLLLIAALFGRSPKMNPLFTTNKQLKELPPRLQEPVVAKVAEQLPDKDLDKAKKIVKEQTPAK